MERTEVIKYLASLKHVERQLLLMEVREVESKIENAKYKKNKTAYQKSVEKKELRGEEMKEKVKPGMVVICEGTRDRVGLREVLSVGKNGIMARKISKERGIDGPRFIRQPYITDHAWMKVKRIVSGNITLEYRTK